MGVHVGHDAAVAALANPPNLIHAGSIEENAALKTIRINIVIGQKGGDRPHCAFGAPQEETAAFAVASAPLPKLTQGLLPQPGFAA